jgi:hypothetical protein
MQHIVHPGRDMFTGKTKSGKTTLAVEITLKKFVPVVDRIIFLCPTGSQEAFAPLWPYINRKRDVFDPNDEGVIKTISRQLDSQKKVASEMNLPHINTLIFIDDMAGKKILHGNRHSDFADLSLRCNHSHTSIILLTQQPKGITPTFRESLDGLICFPSLKRADREWLFDEYNCMIKKKTFIKLVKQAWKGAGNDDYAQFGEHFLFITFPVRAAPRYFIDFSYELSTRNSKQSGNTE